MKQKPMCHVFMWFIYVQCESFFSFNVRLGIQLSRLPVLLIQKYFLSYDSYSDLCGWVCL